MIRIVSILCLLVFVAGCSKKNIPLDSDQRKSSYAVGQQVGKSLKTQNVEVDVDVIAMSIADALKGESKMTDEELGQAIQKMREDMMAARNKEAEANKKVGDDYLEKNKSAEGFKVTASGLQYKVLTEGTGKVPTKNDTVKVNYKGTLIDGTEFDSSYKRGQPAEFPVTGVIAGWTEALTMMKTGGKWQLVIPAELAYGSRGRPGIPANSVLIFEVELLEIVKPAAKGK